MQWSYKYDHRHRTNVDEYDKNRSNGEQTDAVNAISLGCNPCDIYLAKQVFSRRMFLAILNAIVWSPVAIAEAWLHINVMPFDDRTFFTDGTGWTD